MKKILIVLSIFISSIAYSTDKNTVIEDYLTKLVQKTLLILDNPNFSEQKKLELASDLIKNNLDTKWMGDFTLGRIKKTISDKEYMNFQSVYEEFMILYYTNISKKYTGQRMQTISITYLRDNDYLIKTLLVNPDKNLNISIDYLIRPKPNSPEEYVVFDVITEGISLLKTQREDFRSVINTQNIEGLTNNLKTQIKKLK